MLRFGERVLIDCPPKMASRIGPWFIRAGGTHAGEHPMKRKAIRSGFSLGSRTGLWGTSLMTMGPQFTLVKPLVWCMANSGCIPLVQNPVLGGLALQFLGVGAVMASAVAKNTRYRLCTPS